MWSEKAELDQGGADAGVVELAEEGPEHGGLAGPHFAGQGNEAGMVVDAVEEVGKGLLMILAEKDEAGVGMMVEGLPRSREFHSVTVLV